MLQGTLPRQFIKNARGKPIAVLLPIKEFELVKPMLEDRDHTEEDKLREMEAAVQDPLFLADLEEVMVAFEAVDAEWWELAA